MKASSFDYVRVEHLAHALQLLQQHGYDAKLLAGGQSLVPMMAMRLARPAMLVDIYRLSELKTIDASATGVRMGAAVRQRTVEDARDLHGRLPLVARALQWVGHSQTRNRGTIGGSLVHADPSAELPLAATVLDATLRLTSQEGGERSVPASEFFLGPMFTDTQDTECLLSVDWPVWSAGGLGCAFEETAIRHGDFALASAAAQLQVDEAGVCRRASFGMGGVDTIPRSFPSLAQRLVGERPTAALLRDVAQQAAEACDPGSDLHAGAAYRRHLAAVLAQRVLQQAADMAASTSRSA